MSRPAVFLDRDGVLNEAPMVDGHPRPPDPAELRVLPGVSEACRALRAAGFALIVVTNQPDLARGTRPASEIEAVNRRLREELELDEIVVCPHDDDDGCDCRKPRPGMILEAAQRWDVDLANSVTVGDRWRDIAAGRSAGTRTVFINRHYPEPVPEEPDLIVSELEECISWIIDTTAHRR